MIHIGDSVTGERVEIPEFHTGIFGQSGVGKTKLLKYMISQAVNQGYHILIFDSKVTGPEFEGIGKELPFYIEQSTDPDVYRALLEGVRPNEKGNLEYYRGGFIEICEPEDGEPASNFADIAKNLEAKLADRKKIKGKTRMMYREIQRDHNKLAETLHNMKFEPTISKIASTIDNYPMTNMPTWKLPNLALQGLVVKSVVDWVLRNEESVITVVDEAPNFVNQKKYNPAKDALQRLDAQGRSHEDFGWYSGQTLTGFAKENMKNLWYWVMGREMERNEAKDVHDTQSQKILSVDMIKVMKVREFLVSTPDFTKLVTVPKIEEEKLFPRFKVMNPTDEEILPVVRIGTHGENSADINVPHKTEEDWAPVHEAVVKARQSIRALGDAEFPVIEA